MDPSPFPSMGIASSIYQGKRRGGGRGGDRENVGGVTRGNANEGDRCGGGRWCRVTQPDAMADSWLTDG